MSIRSLTHHRPHWRETEWLQGLGLSLLLLWTPFVNYLLTNSFTFTHSPVLICLGGMALLAFFISLLRLTRVRVWYVLMIAGLVTLFSDISLHTIAEFGNYPLIAEFLVALGLFMKWGKICHRIATAVVAVMLFGTVGLAVSKPDESAFHAPERSVSTTDLTLPRIIHLVFDEHIGVEGIPTEIDGGQQLKERILEFYTKYNFMLYGNAFSHYFYTIDSIPNAFNFSAEPSSASFVERDRLPYKLKSNAYFHALSQKHYRLYILGAGHTDFCVEKNSAWATCSNYDGLALGSVLPDLNFTVSDHVRIILGEYLNQSGLYQGIRKRYQSMWSEFVSRGISLPRWNWDETAIFPHAAHTMGILPGLWKRILGLSSGDFLFAHLLLPHFSYIYKSDCSTHPSIQVFMNGNPGLGKRGLAQELKTDRQSREGKYRLYFQQVDCLYLRLGELFRQMQAAGIYENSIIILHGDHGARLGLHDPYVEDLPVLSSQDYVDAFSTLFAVKFPGEPGGYNTSIKPLEELLAETVGVLPKHVPNPVAKGSEPFVYLMSKEGKFQSVFYPVGP